MTHSWTIPAAIVLVILVAAGIWMYAETPANGSVFPTTEKEYVNDTYGIAFSYPEEYVLTEAERGSAQRGLYVITLMRAEDLPPPVGGEGPPAIDISIYQNNLDTMSLDAWLRGTNASNFKLSTNGFVASTTVDGTEAVAYSWSGLYNATTTAFIHKNNIVAVSGMYLMPDDEIIGTYEDLLDSIELR